MLGVNPETLSRWDRQGRLKAIKIGKKRSQKLGIKVPHKDFSWNQFLLELKQLNSIIPASTLSNQTYLTSRY